MKRPKQRKVKLTMLENDFRLICVALRTQARICRETKNGDPEIIEQFRTALFNQAYPELCKAVSEPTIATEL